MFVHSIDTFTQHIKAISFFYKNVSVSYTSSFWNKCDWLMFKNKVNNNLILTYKMKK